MRLVFHCGLNKAGSTYLQDLFCYNYAQLLNIGICYSNPQPVTKGFHGVQAGNAANLAHSIRTLDYSSASQELRLHVETAKQLNCNTLLLSTEYMYHQIIKNSQRDFFVKLCAHHDITEIIMVLVVRNIYAHAVSAYCHRAQIVELPCFTEWICSRPSNDCEQVNGINHYEYWSEAPRLTDVSNDKRLSLKTFDLASDLTYSVGKYLGVELVAPGKISSNVSITCAEAEVCYEIKNINPSYAIKYRELSKQLPRRQKASDQYIRYFYFQEIQKAIESWEDKASVAQLLGSDIFLMPEIPAHANKDTLSTISQSCLLLSRSQVKSLIQAVADVDRSQLSGQDELSFKQIIQYAKQRLKLALRKRVPPKLILFLKGILKN